MTKPDDNLAEALGKNGAFDPDKARELKENAVDAFKAKMRTAERYLWVYLCLCVWLFVFTLFHFFYSSTTKAMLFYGLLMLVFFETTILMKLWYWIVNNKITVLKELKQLQLGQPRADDADAPPREAKRLEGPLRGTTRRERAAWWVVLIAGAVLVGVLKGSDTYWSPGCGASLTHQGCVTLATDGSGSAVTEMSFVYQGIDPTDSFNFHAPKEAVLRFTDSRGRELPFTTSPHDGHVRYDVSLIGPVFPGHRFSYTRTQDRPDYATHEGGLWTYAMDYSYGYGTSELAETVVLPEGAEIVSVTPWPVASFTLKNKLTVRFEATRGRNELFKYTIQYRLPAETTEQNPAG